MEALNDNKKIMVSRENNYRILSLLYQTEVTEELYNKLKTLDYETVKSLEISEGYAMIESFINENRKDPLTDLAVEYAGVFLGAGAVDKYKSANPYGSVYTHPERLIMQDERDKVVAIYRKHGVDKKQGFDVPEDHISIELEFMAYLCSAAKECGDQTKFREYLEIQKEFITKHLLNWIPQFNQDILRLSKTDFYKGLAVLTLDLIKADLELIEEMLSEN